MKKREKKQKKRYFGNEAFSKKMRTKLAKVGIKPLGPPIRFKPLFSKEVNKFLRELDEAHRLTAKSKLRFGQAA